MSNSRERKVEITADGRNGRIRYVEADGTVTFYWEFGGGDVVAIVQVQDAVAWNERSGWITGRRGDILRYVADEVIRQKALGCVAAIDEEKGSILFRKPSTLAERKASDAAWMGRYRALRMKIAVVVLVAALLFGGAYWFVQRAFSIDPGKGTPVGASVRTGTHIATLIQTLEPYLPSPDRDHGKDTYRISLFLVPLDGSDPKHIPLIGGLSPNSFSLAKILGSDGRVFWYDVDGTGGIDLRSYAALSEEAVLRATTIPEPKRSNGLPYRPAPEAHLAAGYFIGPNSWLGLHSSAEAERHFKPKSWLKRVVQAEDAKQLRLFHRAELDPDTSDGHHRIMSIEAIGTTEYLNAAFLRMDESTEPLRLTNPTSALIAYTSESGMKGTVIVARVDTIGNVLWSVDTGIDRFKLEQILPGETSIAFVGTRPPVPGKVSEPLLVIMDARTGLISTTSLWQ